MPPKPARSTAAPADLGTPEIHRRQAVGLELTGRGHAVRARVHDSCEIDRLYALGLLTQDQHSAGESLARRLHTARLIGMPISRPERTSASADISTAYADALAHVGDTLDWLTHDAGHDATRALLAVLTTDARPDQAALGLVRRALDSLLALRPDRPQRAPVPTLWD